MRRGTQQQALTLLVPVRKGHGPGLQSKLSALSERIHTAFAWTPSVHQARVLVLPGADAAAELLVETTFDGELGAHLSELESAGGALFQELFEDCAEAPVANGQRAFSEFVGRRSLRNAGFYFAYAGLSVKTIREDAELGRAVSTFLKEPLAAEHASALAFAEHVQRALLVHGVLPEAALQATEPPSLAAPGAWQALSERLPQMALLAGLAPVFKIWDWTLGATAKTPGAPCAARLPDAAPLDARAPTAFALLTRRKRGALRRSAQAWAVELAEGVLRHTGAHLGPGGLASLHALRFVVLDGERLLVTASHDGSSRLFLDRLVETANPFVSALFMHAEGFPPQRWLTRGGARHSALFQQWLRTFQISTPVWYSAYPELSVVDIMRNQRLRMLLTDTLNAASAQTLCALL